MEKQNLEFAGIDLKNYISKKGSTNDNDSLQEKIKKITNQINKIESPLAMEKQALQEFQKQRNSLETKLKYSILDVSFLNASNKIEHKGKEIYVPKFCIYNVGENKFSMRIYRESGLSLSEVVDVGAGAGFGAGVVVGGVVAGVAGVDLVDVGIGAGAGGVVGGVVGGVIANLAINYYNTLNIKFPNLPDIFTNELIKTTEFFKYSKYKKINEIFEFKQRKFPMEIKTKYKENIELNSYLNGIIPIETKQKIKQAKQVFDNKIYLIAETETQNWNIKKYNKNPLVVGVNDKKCYFIDKFNTTILEDYASEQLKSM